MRTSKNGATTRVRHHTRSVSIADLIEKAKGTGSGRTVTAGALGGTAVLALTYAATAFMSTLAALMFAITVVMVSVLSLVAGAVIGKKRQKKRKAAALAAKRIIRWAAHKTGAGIVAMAKGAKERAKRSRGEQPAEEPKDKRPPRPRADDGVTHEPPVGSVYHGTASGAAFYTSTRKPDQTDQERHEEITRELAGLQKLRQRARAVGDDHPATKASEALVNEQLFLEGLLVKVKGPKR